MRKPANPNIIDIEASGFGSASYPIEVGIVLQDQSKYCSLIQPPPDWNHWDTEAEKVHRIGRNTLQTHGKPMQSVATTLNELLQGKVIYSDGWVVDKTWLDTLFYRARVRMEFRVSPLELILSEQQMERWHATKESILAGMKDRRHRASFDAWLIQETYRQTQAETISELG